MRGFSELEEDERSPSDWVAIREETAKLKKLQDQVAKLLAERKARE